MATISVSKVHHLNHAKAKGVAEKMAKDLPRKFDLACTWDGGAGNQAAVDAFKRAA